MQDMTKDMSFWWKAVQVNSEINQFISSKFQYPKICCFVTQQSEEKYFDNLLVKSNPSLISKYLSVITGSYCSGLAKYPPLFDLLDYAG